MSVARTERLHPAIVEQAAQWMMRTHGALDADLEAACTAWRQADSRHELAWQRLQGISQDLGAATAGPVSGAAAGQTILRYCDQRSRRSALKWIAGGVVLGSCGWLGARQGLWDGSDVYRTATGEQRTLTLPDGTVLTMNTGSVVSLRYDAVRRQLVLREGEIMIATAAEPAGRPFSVKTPNAWLTPLGTRFAVRQLDDGRSITRLTVFEGAVRAEPAQRAQAARVVHAGEMAELDDHSLLFAAAVAEDQPAWANGMLVANRMRLDRFLAELGRYRPGVLRCDAEVASREVTGAFRVDDTDRALEVLASVLGLQLRYHTRYWVSVGQPDGPGRKL
ncbi:FecR family protein [Bordetella genomosp. 12]|uniref:Iron dicitrate transport regulator FecR n=1 Tax=Bordetella genomosp. 12 TaxID=463035 RepID=A0A261VBU5_9BORD|nr:FecR family protein [Bordetella genomosp. 12]OZI71626.1 iron dicitrate transport regulator FecR [Bordetella genomosp. 12]